MPITFLRKLRSQLVPRRADILGREQGQTVVRVVIVAILLFYLVASHYPLDLEQASQGWLVYLVVFLVFSLAIAAAALRDRRSPAYRRIVANIGDIATITYLMSNTGEAGAALFLLYLWVTLGNGFRFGLAAMGISALLSVVGFAAVMASVDFWRQHTTLSAGIMVALVVLPAYAAHLIRQLHRARERAEEASAAKSQFLARMSHELRTPLNGVLGTTDLLRNNRRLNAADRELLGVIKESVDVSLRQIDSVLDFARIEAGKLVLEQAEFDLHRMLNATVRMVSPAAHEKNLRLLVRISPQAPFRLIGDSHHLREILLNLLSNAIKFTHSGYVAIQVEPIEVTDDAVRLRFEIRDTGIGIATEALGHIWESFAQEDSGTNRRYGGTGLGTTIAKQLVELMNGKIAVSSIKGRGAVFWCDLPFQRPSGRDQAEAAVAGARVLALTTDAESVQHLQQGIATIRGTLLATATMAEAIAALVRGIRLGNPWHLVLVDERLAVTHGDWRPPGMAEVRKTQEQLFRHRADELAAKVLTTQTPLFLVTDKAREVEQLCEWGYAGVMSRLPVTEVLANAIHASPHYDTDTGGTSSVMRVEPWAWGREAKTATRILVADDNRINRLILEQILASAGYAVDLVSDGETALQRITTGRYQAAVLDLHMPGLSGDDLLRRYRLMKPGVRIPIVMLTADVTFDAKSDCADAGADAFLTKPVSAEILLSTLERLIHDRQVHSLPAQALHADGSPVETEPPTLDVSVLAELDRLSRDPTSLMVVIETFESEGETLLANIAGTVAARNHPAFMEWVHALKGNAMNVGATRLVAACQRAEAAGVLDFRQHGEDRVRELGAQLVAARQALRELTSPTANPGYSGH
ncbi:MAG TPA: ATP-binding protein [Acidiferrobacterales bacterium]|nr:ATP-binding protein [Acidiferrobacterales bacterium]